MTTRLADFLGKGESAKADISVLHECSTKRGAKYHITRSPRSAFFQADHYSPQGGECKTPSDAMRLFLENLDQISFQISSPDLVQIFQISSRSFRSRPDLFQKPPQCFVVFCVPPLARKTNHPPPRAACYLALHHTVSLLGLRSGLGDK